MKTNTKIARHEAKQLIIKYGINNIINSYINDVVTRTGVSHFEMQKAMNYFRFSKSQENFRQQYC